MYLVKWKGYKDSENTWEPKSNLTHAPKLLEEYEAVQKEREKAEKKEVKSSAPKKAPDPRKVKKKTSSTKKTAASSITKKASTTRPTGRRGRPTRHTSS